MSIFPPPPVDLKLLRLSLSATPLWILSLLPRLLRTRAPPDAVLNVFRSDVPIHITTRQRFAAPRMWRLRPQVLTLLRRADDIGNAAHRSCGLACPEGVAGA
jgi:hypothetical protein